MSDARRFVYRRVVVALNGGSSDARIVRIGAETTREAKGELIAIHVVEIDWTLPLDADIVEHLREQVARPANERQALPVLFGTGSLADEHQVGIGIARAENDLGTGGAEVALDAVAGLAEDRDQLLPALFGVARHSRSL